MKIRNPLRHVRTKTIQLVTLLVLVVIVVQNVTGSCDAPTQQEAIPMVQLYGDTGPNPGLTGGDPAPEATTAVQADGEAIQQLEDATSGFKNAEAHYRKALTNAPFTQAVNAVNVQHDAQAAHEAYMEQYKATQIARAAYIDAQHRETQ